MAFAGGGGFFFFSRPASGMVAYFAGEVAANAELQKLRSPGWSAGGWLHVDHFGIMVGRNSRRCRQLFRPSGRVVISRRLVRDAGIIAALTVPLFLTYDLATCLKPRGRGGGFLRIRRFLLDLCVASRRVLRMLPTSCRRQLDQVKRGVNHLKQQNVRRRPPSFPRRTRAPAAAELAAKAEPVKESLSYNDVEILRAIAEENYVYGNLVGLTDNKTGLSRDLVSNRLTVLRTWASSRPASATRTCCTGTFRPRASLMLGEILAQESAKEPDLRIHSAAWHPAAWRSPQGVQVLP